MGLNRMNFEQDAAISEISNVLSNYDLGKLNDLERNYRGYLNISYSIQTIKHGKKSDYFLRRYRIGTKPGDIEFEHTVVNHLIEKNFNLVAKVFPTKDGSTYCTKFLDDDQEQPIFYAIFEYLQGDDKYTWVDPHCSPREIEDAATILSMFHQAVADIIPRGQKTEPRIIDLLPQISNNLEKYQPKELPSEFDECLTNNLPRLLSNCAATLNALKKVDEGDWPSIVIHCDYHPGNLKYSGETIVGLFDFDWSKVDLRCFDVALAGWYFFTSWGGTQDGIFRVDEFRTFLDIYQEAFRDKTLLVSMNEIELNKLVWMINAANLYILNWTVEDYFSKDVDPDEYLKYLRHCLNFTHWFDLDGLNLISTRINPMQH